MPERLSSLNRQKQLIEEHLRWLELEIANESGQSATPPETDSQSENLESPTEAIPFPPIKTPAVALEVEAPEEEGEEESEQMAEQIISQYGQFSSSREMDPRLGLVLFFGGILGFLALTIFLFYWFGYR